MHHISAHSGCDRCCVRFDQGVEIAVACLSPGTGHTVVRLQVSQSRLTTHSFISFTRRRLWNFFLPPQRPSQTALDLLSGRPGTVGYSSINTICDCKYFCWHQRTEPCYPRSSCIHFCRHHAQTLFVLLFAGMRRAVLAVLCFLNRDAFVPAGS